MKILNIMYYTFSNIYLRKTIFFLNVITVFISFCLLDKGILTYYVNNYQIYASEKLFQNKDNNLYKIGFDYITIPDDTITNNRTKFLDELKDIAGVKASGKYYKNTINLTDESNNDNLVDVMFIDPQIISMCKLTSIEGDDITLDLEPEYEPIIVGYNLKDTMPLGSKYINTTSKKEYIVTQILEKDSRWVASGYLISDISDTVLDDMVICNLDEYYLTGIYYIGNESYRNNVYLYIDKDKNADEIIDNIYSCAASNDTYISVKSLPQYIKNYRDTYQDYYKMTNILAGILLLVTAISTITASIYSVLFIKRDYGIMYANGFIKKDILKIVAIENSLRIIMGVVIGLAYSEYKNSYLYLETGVNMHREIIPIMILIWGILTVLCTAIPMIILSKIRPVELINL